MSTVEPETRIADRYEVEARLGEGGMGVVATARDLRLGRKVAIKLLSADASQASVMNPQVPAAADAAFARALSKAPDERFPDVLAFVDALLAAPWPSRSPATSPRSDAEKPYDVALAKTEPAMPPATPKRRASSLRPLGVVAAAAAVTIVGVAAAWRHGQPPTVKRAPSLTPDADASPRRHPAVVVSRDAADRAHGDATAEDGDATFAAEQRVASEVDRVLRGALGAIRHCYEIALRHDRHLSGRIEIRFTVDASGCVTGSPVATMLGSTITTSECIEGVVRRLLFPRHPQGPTDYTFPFTFAPGGRGG